MNYKIMILQCILLSSCQLLNQKEFKSEWQTLKEAKDVDCQKWPQRKTDLEILGISSAEISNDPGFVVVSRNRTGRESIRYRRFEGGLEDESIDLNWGGSAKYVGSYSIKGLKYFVIERTIGRNKVVELRNPKTNVVEYSTKKISLRTHILKSLPSKNGLWVVYKNYSNDISRDESPVKILELTPNEKAGLDINYIKNVKLSPDAKVVVNDDRHLFVMWKLKKKKRDDAPKFSYTILEDAKKKPTVYSLGNQMKYQVESWNLSTHRDGTLAVFVSGDTLIWENASMELKYFDFKGDQSWSKSVKIENEHIGDPLLVSLASFTYLVLPKWLDGESTLAVTKIRDNELEDMGNFGVFKEGTFIVSALQPKGESRPYVIKQYPVGFIKKYSICEIEL